MNLHEIANLGADAKALAENPAFVRAIEQARNAALEGIAATRPRDSAEREFLYSIVRAIPFVHEAILIAVNAGDVSAKQLRELAAKAERESKQPAPKDAPRRRSIRPTTAKH